MADPIYKVVEVVGTSEQSISKAIENAINKASGTLRNLGWFEVAQMRGAIKDGEVQRYQVTLKVGLRWSSSPVNFPSGRLGCPDDRSSDHCVNRLSSRRA